MELLGDVGARGYVDDITQRRRLSYQMRPQRRDLSGCERSSVDCVARARRLGEDISPEYEFLMLEF